MIFINDLLVLGYEIKGKNTPFTHAHKMRLARFIVWLRTVPASESRALRLSPVFIQAAKSFGENEQVQAFTKTNEMNEYVRLFLEEH